MAASRPCCFSNIHLIHLRLQATVPVNLPDKVMIEPQNVLSNTINGHDIQSTEGITLLGFNMTVNLY